MFKQLKDKRILVTGGSGFVGTNLIKRLLEVGCKNIRATYHDKQPNIFNKNVTYIKSDLTITEDCDLVTKDIDYVIMCAANSHGAAYMEANPLCLVTPNVVMNTLMLNASYENKIEKFIFISSSTVYPVVDYPIDEEGVIEGSFFEKYYQVGWMKRFGEVLCYMYSCKIKEPMITVIIRPSNIYGPYEDFELETSHVIPALIKKIVERRECIEIWGDGNDIRDFIYIDDFINGLLLITEKVNEFNIFNLGTGKTSSLKEVLKHILKIENYENVPLVFNKDKPTMISKRLINVDKIKNMLGFASKVDIEEGLRKIIKWYKESIRN
jgi:GDP-L-fucose synthase